jgi:23S rRNA (cytidine1920-2'-O)/16S rRNA (cytidine1409-2'-O)-methyltransferase
VSGLCAADIGASTGGFTDCLLQHGARKVFAVDVGHGQLAQSLRDDQRVVVMERTNARHLHVQSLGEAVALVVVDASFISLEKLLDAIFEILEPGGRLLALIKPQFEVGRAEASRHKGVIKDAGVRDAAVERTLQAVAESGFEVLGDCESDLKGPKGNLEHFVLARRRARRGSNASAGDGAADHTS